MQASGEDYRRLPGRRRGIASSASMWMGSDHLLLVKSAWFREEYKRFYLRDIQAIVVAPCARYHVSLPVFIFALLWVLPGFGMMFWPVGLRVVWGAGSLAMLATWFSISAASSCRCRLYTAVSKDDLPSLYRTWTARKFLRQVKPSIDQVQGTVDAGWMEIERAAASPAEATPAIDAALRTGGRAHTLAFDLFVLSLFAGAIVDITTLHTQGSATFRISNMLTLLQMAGAITVLVQCYRGTLRRSCKGLAIAALAVIGAMFYVQTFALSFTAAVEGISPKGASILIPGWVMAAHQLADGVAILLGLIGAALILRSSFTEQPDIIKD